MQNVLALNQYLTSCACKGAASTSEMVSLSNSSLKSLAHARIEFLSVCVCVTVFVGTFAVRQASRNELE